MGQLKGKKKFPYLYQYKSLTNALARRMKKIPVDEMMAMFSGVEISNKVRRAGFLDR